MKIKTVYTNEEVKAILLEDYNKVTQVGEYSYIGYLEYIDETHEIYFNGHTIWGYNPVTNHRWAIA